jgi:hypothetical protein
MFCATTSTRAEPSAWNEGPADFRRPFFCAVMCCVRQLSDAKKPGSLPGSFACLHNIFPVRVEIRFRFPWLFLIEK